MDSFFIFFTSSTEGNFMTLAFGGMLKDAWIKLSTSSILSNTLKENAWELLT